VIIWKVSLQMVAVKEKEGLLKQMVVTTKVILEIMWPMAMGSISIQADINIRDSGKATFQMDEAKQSIPIRASIMDAFLTIENMEKGYLCKRDVFLKEIS